MRNTLKIKMQFKACNNLFCYFLIVIFYSCSPTEENKDMINLNIKSVDSMQVGRKLFHDNCLACHNMAADSIKITGTNKTAVEIKEILDTDTVTHNRLSFITIEEARMIRKYLNRGPEY